MLHEQASYTAEGASSPIRAAQAAAMPRDMTACGRYPPQPWYKPIAFYSAVRLGDPEELAKVMARDPYYLTQDNGAGAPVHFATTYRQLDMARSLSLPLRIAAHLGAPRVPSA